MKITTVKTYRIPAACPVKSPRDFLLIELETDEGITGLGCASNWPMTSVCDAAIRAWAPGLIGRDIHDREAVYEDFCRFSSYIGTAGAVMSAIAGIDMALWDILGQSLGRPVYQLLGGLTHRDIRAYANYWSMGLPYHTKAYQDAAMDMVAQGYHALKFLPFRDLPGNGRLSLAQLDASVGMVCAVREVLPADVALIIECAGGLNVQSAREFARALEGLPIAWLEEPLPPENHKPLADLARTIRVPIATGERFFSRYHFLTALQAGALHVAQPDLCRAGGITEVKKIADLAHAFYVNIAPHNAGSPVGSFASMHLCAAIPNFEVLEHLVQDAACIDAIVTRPVRVRDGFFQLPDAPGLGTALHPDAVRHYAEDVWQTP